MQVAVAHYSGKSSVYGEENGEKVPALSVGGGSNTVDWASRKTDG